VGHWPIARGPVADGRCPEWPDAPVADGPMAQCGRWSDGRSPVGQWPMAGQAYGRRRV